ncbi:MAG: hypothetical protein Q7R59_01820 [bacterium]|nr:hypothetical protein [bacterium]
MSCADEPVWLHVCKSNNFPDEKIAEWEKLGICCIDVGRRKYHQVNEGSATEWLVEHYRLARTAGIAELIEVINKNNRTGYLKSFRNAVPFIMREMYELEGSDADWWSVRVLHEAAKVVTAFVRVANGEAVRQPHLMDADLATLANDFGQGDKPLTLGQYVWNLWMLGEESEAIFEKLEFWQDGVKRLADARQRAKALVAQAIADGTLPRFYVRNFPGILLENRDHFFTKEVLHTHKFAVRVIVDGDGHATISTNSLDCTALATFLERGEPGMWHHNEQMGALINGGPQYIETPPTKITANKLVELVKNPTLAPKKK